MNENLIFEAQAFDDQINERVSNGHIPDLRRSGRCEYFYNNIWRDNHFVDLYYGELVRKEISFIKEHFKEKENHQIKILEVGCGPGHVCLEFARNGFNVTGLDVSKKCIEVAKITANNDPWKTSRGTLKYATDDFFKYRINCDVVIFTCSLHHFPNSKVIVAHASEILSSNGLILVDEPIRDHLCEKNAAVILLVKGLLAASNSFYKSIDIPQTEAEAQTAVNKIFLEEKYETKDGEKVQSINDNESDFPKMYLALTDYFDTLSFEKNYALYHQIIGGVRLASREDEYKVAHFLKQMDSILCKTGAINPTNFFFAGIKKIR